MSNDKNFIFIKKVISKFGDNKYSFENLKYKSQYDKTYITCLNCNKELFITPKNFLNSKGCIECYNNSYFKRDNKTKELFIQECINKYGKDKFDYSLVEYKNTNTNVLIKCNDCNNIRTVTPNSFLNNINGCLECLKKINNYTNIENFKINTKINSLEKFLLKAKEIHGNKYNYSKFKYINSETKSIIICNIHGEFLQNSHQHIGKKSNCPKCSTRLKEKEQFIEEALIVHPKGSFDYTLINYIGANNKITIKCCSCNEIFEQTPSSHLKMKTHCCNKCSGNNNYTNLEFIEKSKIIFKNKFNYKYCNYENQYKKIKLKCKDCNSIFNTLPNVHLDTIAGGCNNCFKKHQLEKHKNLFFQKMKKKFGNEIDLSLVNYIDRKTDVILKCTKNNHIFKQTPSSKIFSTTNPCPICSKTIKKNNNLFILDAKKIHGNKYDYNLINYKNAFTKIEIKCNKCNNLFLQKPNVHLNGSGCPKCAVTGFDMNKFGILYYILIDGRYYKIGITNKSIKERFQSDQNDIRIIKEWYYYDGEECYNMEQYYLKEFEWAKVKNVNVLSSGNSELFLFDVLNLDFD